MSWGTPTTRPTGFLVTAAVYNADLVNNLIALHADTVRYVSANNNVLVVTGAASVTTDASGNATISYGYTFSGLLSVIAIPRVSSTEQLATSSATLSDFTIGWLNHASFGPFFLDWVAYGT